MIAPIEIPHLKNPQCCIVLRIGFITCSIDVFIAPYKNGALAFGTVRDTKCVANIRTLTS